MHRRKLLLASAATTAAAVAGCLGSAQENDPDTGESDRTVTVSESGDASADPDLAVVRTGVEATGEDADEVRDELAERSEALRDALLADGLNEDDVTTDRFTVRERVDHRRMEEEGVDPGTEREAEEYVYYEGTHSFTVEIHDVDAIGGVIDTAIDAGADDVGRIEFTLSEDRREELREQALEDALERARSEAEFVASEVDASVVEARRVDTSGGDVTPVTEDVEMDVADDDPSTELHPDDVTVGATVTVEYEIE